MLSLNEVMTTIYEEDAAAVTLDVADPATVDSWWDDEGWKDVPFTKNAHHAGIVATAITVGQLQREQGLDLVTKTAEYFSLAKELNHGLRRTKFVRLFTEALGGGPLTVGKEYPAEFVLASQRTYPPFSAPFNFAPHCDDISYSRAEGIWPMKKSYPQQLGSFLVVTAAENNAGFVMWDYKPSSRAELDELHNEYKRDGKMRILEDKASLTIKSAPGQLTTFACRNIHAIEQCTSLRRTMGLFMIKDENGYHYFE
jgi:hypothetical protein